MGRLGAACVVGAVVLLAVWRPAPAASQRPRGDAGAKRPLPALVDLSEADFHQERGLVRLASALVGTFQILARRDPGSTEPAGAASPPADEGGPALYALCSGSFLADGSAVTARHCIAPFPDDFAGRLVLRRHLYGISDGRLERTGHEDYFLSGKILAARGDLVSLELSADTPAPRQGRFSPPRPSFGYQFGQEFQALGYPSARYGAPSLARGCTIEDPVGGSRMTAIRPSEYYARCMLADGMSGGPQFLLPRGAQIGVNSSMTDYADGQFGVSARMTALDSAAQ
ncbi:MAG: hypothetical protein HY927_14635 [Elusimicrobia bacterium]|nr:hypothetical protein [Elusimicrobiota bacterium]